MTRKFEPLQKEPAVLSPIPATRPQILLPGADPFGLEETQQSALWDYLRVVRKHAVVLLLPVLLLVPVVTVVSLLITPTYEASGRITINRENNQALGFKDERESAQDDPDYIVTLDTQVDVLQSQSLALATIKKLDLANNPAYARDKATRNVESDKDSALLRHFRESLDVTRLPRSRIIEIRFTSPDPVLAANVVNTLIDLYEEQNFRNKFLSTTHTSTWLAQELQDLKKQVESSQQALVTFQRQHGIVGSDDKQNVIMAKLDELNRDYTTAEADRIQKEALYHAAVDSNPELLAGSDSNALIEKLRADEAEIERKYAEATTTMGPNHPKVRELQSQAKQLADTIEREKKRLAARYATEYRAALTREKLLARSLDEQKKLANALNESAIQYSTLKHEAEANRQLYDGLLQKFKEATISAGLRSDNVRVVDRALVPSKPLRPRPLYNAALAFVAATLASGMLALLFVTMDRHHQQTAVCSPEQIYNMLGLPALGVVPALKATGYGRKQLPDGLTLKLQPSTSVCAALASYSHPQSALAESYRSICTTLLLGASGVVPRMIVVTSALAREGKTTTSGNLAIVTAQRGERVLLVDADMRRAGLSRDFDCNGDSPSPGLNALLERTVAFEQAVRQPLKSLPLLYFLPTRAAQDPVTLIGSKYMQALLARWREEFDCIIFDTPPTLMVTDAVLLSSAADLVVLVTRYGTPAEALIRTRNLVLLAKPDSIATLLNAVELDERCGYYGSYKAYGSTAA